MKRKVKTSVLLLIWILTLLLSSAVLGIATELEAFPVMLLYSLFFSIPGLIIFILGSKILVHTHYPVYKQKLIMLFINYTDISLSFIPTGLAFEGTFGWLYLSLMVCSTLAILMVPVSSTKTSENNSKIPAI